jgi:YesN/AraC family two-component response regulator
MVCFRCKMVVISELEKLALHYKSIDLGEIEILENLTNSQHEQLTNNLKYWGLEVMDDSKAVLIEKIKNVIIEMIHFGNEDTRLNFSDFITEKLKFDYTYLSNLFSEATGITIEHYIITHKIERVKELLLCDEMSLSEIAYKLNYSSVAHLSNQFKKITGLTLTMFRQLKQRKLSSCDNIERM